MLDGLSAIPWADLTQAYGKADDVPRLLRELASSNNDRREEALNDLFGSIWHQGTVYPATAPAISFLVELALTPAVGGRADIMGLLGAIAVSSDGPREVHQEVVRHADLITRLLTDNEPVVRAGAAYVLGSLYERAETIRAELRSRIGGEQDALVRASMLLAIASLADPSAENVEWLERHFAESKDHRERFATAFALAHCARDATPTTAITLLANACKDPTANSKRFEGFRWDMQDETMPRRALVASGTAAHQALPILLDALRAEDDEIVATFLLEDALAVVFGSEEPDHAPVSLDEPQRQVLRAAANTPIVWEHPHLFASSLEQYCLPTNRSGLLSLIDA